MSVSLNYSLQVNVNIEEPYILTQFVIFREPLRGVGAAQPAAARRVRGARRGRGRQQALLRSGVRYAVTVITLTLS